MTLSEFNGDWSAYRMCHICRAPAGVPCYTRSGLISRGRTDGVARTLDRPHIARRRSTRKAAGR